MEHSRALARVRAHGSCVKVPPIMGDLTTGGLSEPGPVTDLDTLLAAELDRKAADGRLRACPRVDGSTRHSVIVDGGATLVSFCSNDYLGLAQHPTLQDAATQALIAHGAGSGAARLVSGNLPEHGVLEDALAAFMGWPSAALFSTGYQANLGVITALAGPNDLIASDALNHASIIDGCRLSKARIAIYRHGDPDSATRALATPGSFRRRFLVTESVFSMDGDTPPLRALERAARSMDAIFIVDEAHAVGALGPDGRGLCAETGVSADVIVGTLGKAFGSFGGFVVGSSVLCRHLVNHARSFIFTTALPPSVSAASAAAVALLRTTEGSELRARLARNIVSMRRALSLENVASDATASPISATPSSIIPVILGDDNRALDVARKMRDEGFFVQAIRPPTVPEGTARLRVTVSSAHTEGEIIHFAAALRRLVSA